MAPADRWHLENIASVNGLKELYSSYLVQMLFTVKMRRKRGTVGCHPMMLVFAHGPRVVEAR
jgi:hypothetical protein